MTQLRVILDQADSLLQDFGNYLGSSDLPQSAPEWVNFGDNLSPVLIDIRQIRSSDTFLCALMPLLWSYRRPHFTIGITEDFGGLCQRP